MKKTIQEYEKKMIDMGVEARKLEKTLQVVAKKESEKIESLANREMELKAQLEKAHADIFSVQSALMGFRERNALKIKELEEAVAYLREKLEEKVEKLASIVEEKDQLSLQLGEMINHSYQQEAVISKMREQLSNQKKVLTTQSGSRTVSPLGNRLRATRETEATNTEELERNLEQNMRIERLEKENESLKRELRALRDQFKGSMPGSVRKTSGRRAKKNEVQAVQAEKDVETIERGARNLRELNRLKDHLNSILKTPSSRGSYE